ncbi:hypothetical protein EDB83DRAFT_1876621 [Lactarius deliciosus]|nr:hypothetical protein EDB83DRAFT_1876621 [Lactarius deliciosus]
MPSIALESDSDTARPASTPRNTHGDSPEQPAQSDDPGPGDSDGESEVYEIEAILDAKRGATGSTRIGYLVKWKGYPDEENSWVDERDAGGAKELIADYWLRHGKKKGEKVGRKSDVRPKASPRHPVAPSVETSSEPISTATKKRARFRQKARAESGDEDVEEDTRSRKRGRKSNGISRKASPSPASSDKEPPSPELLEPSTIKKWVNLPSWDRHIQTIDTVERMDDGDLFIYFKLKGEKVGCKETSKVCAEKFPQELIKFYEAHLKWRQTEHESD